MEKLMWLLLEMREKYNKMAKFRVVVLGMEKKKKTSEICHTIKWAW